MPFLTAQALISQPPKRPPFLITGLIPEKGRMLIVGRPKVGKSILAIDMALCLLEGKPFLGAFPTKKTRVALILAEGSDYLLGKRLAVAKQAIRNGVWSNLFYQFTTNLRLERDADILRLGQDLTAIQPEILILDPLYKIWAQSYVAMESISELTGKLDTLGESLGMANVVIHHLRKPQMSRSGQKFPQTTDDTLGSTGFTAWADTTIALHETASGLAIEFEVRWLPPMETVPVEMDIRRHPFFKMPNPPAVAQVLSGLKDGPATITALSRKTNLHHSKVSRIVDELGAAGFVEEKSNHVVLSA